MARAAAKRTPRPKPAARPQPSRKERKANRPVEDTLFFTRLRNHAKWMFVLLAVAFGGGFVFFGVGSGSSGIGDLLQGNFGAIFGSSSSGPSISKIQSRINKNPKDAAAYLDLAHAYEAKKQDISAISALETYAKLRPRDTNALNELAGLYTTRAQLEQAAAQDALKQQSSQLTPTFGPTASSPLGRALADPIQAALQTQGPSAAYQTLITQLQATLRSLEGTYQRLVTADPTDPTSLLLYGQAAQQANDPATALAAYRKFLKKFPDDPNVGSARAAIRQLTGQTTPSPSG